MLLVEPALGDDAKTEAGARYNTASTDVSQKLRTNLPQRVLCLDDDPAVLALCEAALTRAGFRVDVVSNGWEALQKLNDHPYAVVLLDLFMPALHGRTTLAMIQQIHPEIVPRVVVMTGLSDNAIDDLYGKVGAILRKPLKIDALVEFVTEFAGPQPQAG